jgi:catechol 2,3-dioxygenase-like lactoylglutathione lyase family enzyme
VPELNAIGIVASDMERSLAFYRLLGLDFPEDGEGHIEATTATGFRLMLDTEDVIGSFNPEWVRARGNQLGLAFECASPQEVDAIHAQVVAAGFEAKDPFDAPWGQRYAELHDPDGNPVDLYAAS